MNKHPKSKSREIKALMRRDKFGFSIQQSAEE
jgi:hypothetical protein